MTQCIIQTCTNIADNHWRQRVCEECKDRFAPASKIVSGYRHIANTAKAMIHRAKRRNSEFSINSDDILKIWPYDNRCPVFGTGLRMATGWTGCRKRSPSLDRIDSDRGYTPDNIQIISDLANKMKQNATQEELLKFADWIRNDSTQ